MTLFAELARASTEIAKTRSRNAKIESIAALLATLGADEVADAAGWLCAEPPCGALGLGYANLYALRSEPAAARGAASVSIGEVGAALDALREKSRPDVIAGAAVLFRRMTIDERDFLIASMTSTLRQGGLAGILLAAIAKAGAVDEREVRRAAMVLGSAARVADAILGRGKGMPLPSRLELFQPLAPMLASPRDTVAEGMEGLASARVEWKVDGVRAQIHKRGPRVAAFSRQGKELALGALGDGLAGLTADDAVIDSEVALVDAEGRARPFQETFSAISGGAIASGQRLQVFAFDCLHRDGRDLVDEPLTARVEALAQVVPEAMRMPAIVTASVEEAQRFFDDARAHGHEGVVVKALESTYALGARGDAWRKVKAIVTVDLVVLAVEWGSGRRNGWLSNLHLGARRADGTFCMVGKTFKGLTDEMLAWQTKKLLELGARGEYDEHTASLATRQEASRDRHVVFVRPELVVEIAFNDVQTSPRYPGGIALRFARVVRYREDKNAAEADTLDTLLARLPADAKQREAKPKRPKKPEKANKQLSLFDDEVPRRTEKPPVRAWDAEAYHRLSAPQTAWGKRVLTALELRGDETVLDAGCGTGKLSAELLERLPRGRLIALDSSADMLRVARETLAPYGERVSFVQADLRALDLDGVCDVVFSTATFHWVKDHDALFRALFRALRVGGRLHAQCGGGANLERIHLRAEALMHEPAFAPFFGEWAEPWYFSSAEDAERRMTAAGFGEARAWLEDAPTLMPDRDTYRAFVEKVILAAHLAKLPDASARAAFLDALTNAAEKDDPPFSLDYVRLNLRATKP